MGKKIRQADGSYCYTENCRIHDRSGKYQNDSGSSVSASEPGISKAPTRFAQTPKIAVATDIEISNKSNLRDKIQDVIVKNVHSSRKDETYAAAQTVVDSIYENGDADPATIAYDLAAHFGQKVPVGSEDMTVFRELGTKINSEVFIHSMVRQADYVYVPSKGKLGYVSNGSSFMGGKLTVEVDGEDSPVEYNPTDVVKVNFPVRGSAKTQLVAAPQEAQLKSTIVNRILEQETHNYTTTPSNKKALTVDQQKVLKEELTDASERFSNFFKDQPVTRGRVSRYLVDEARKRRPWLSDTDSDNVKTALTDIASYVRPDITVN